jgi:hypothetical protein
VYDLRDPTIRLSTNPQAPSSSSLGTAPIDLKDMSSGGSRSGGGGMQDGEMEVMGQMNVIPGSQLARREGEEKLKLRQLTNKHCGDGSSLAICC